jgi:putative endonuclease
MAEHNELGKSGEEFAANYLQENGFEILEKNYTFQKAEIDIIAQYQDTMLAFVEVKTRSSRNWDEGGKNAITPQKQAKIWRTAEIFLAEYPQKADYACRFDVALVHYQLQSKNIISEEFLERLSIAGYEFKLLQYIEAAFEQ